LQAHPLIAVEYGELKERLARQNPNDIDAYIDGKDAFVKEHERRALLWTRKKQWAYIRSTMNPKPQYSYHADRWSSTLFASLWVEAWGDQYPAQAAPFSQ